MNKWNDLLSHERLTNETTIDPCTVQDHHIPEVLQAILSANIIRDDIPGDSQAAILYDLDAVRNTFKTVTRSFPPHFKHFFTMKSCPLSFMVKEARKHGFGLNCSSFSEVMQALRYGCRVTYNSPFKTRREISIALKSMVDINAENFDELDLIRDQIEHLALEEYPEPTPRYAANISRIGVRINPLFNASPSSKFGIPLTPENRERLINRFVEEPWLCSLYFHLDSETSGVDLLAEGARVLVQLANEIDAVIGAPRIKVISIGGGILSNYNFQMPSPVFANYANTLRKGAPGLFTNSYRNVVTEFGTSLCAQTAWIASGVEYIKRLDDQPSAIMFQTVEATSECKFSAFTKHGIAATGNQFKYDVGRGTIISLPEVEEGDFIITHDVGSTAMEMFNRHRSRPAPAIYGYWKERWTFELQLLKAAETVDDVLSFWN